MRVLEGRRILIVEDDVRNVYRAHQHARAARRAGRRSPATARRRSMRSNGWYRARQGHRPRADGRDDAGDGRPRPPRAQSGNDPRWRKLPIITLTAKAMKDDQEQVPRGRAPTTTWPSRSTSTSCSRSCRVWMPRWSDARSPRPSRTSRLSSAAAGGDLPACTTTISATMPGRRIKRRLAQARDQLGLAAISATAGRIVLHDPAMLQRLLDYLTVQVSEMFRDPSYFRALREKVMPHLRTYPSLKVWVAGCSNGEELYSLVILLREEGLFERTLFYATDINPAALKARRPASIRSTASASSPRTTRTPAGTRRCRTTTPRPTAARSSTSRCAARSCFPTIASSPTRVRRDAPDLVPQCADLFRPQAAGSRRRAVSRFAGAEGLSRDRLQGEPALFHACGCFFRVRQGREDLPEEGVMTARAIVIGTSAGGVQALSRILPALPERFPAPVLIVIHVPPRKGNALIELFEKKCALVVKEAEDKEPLADGVIYFAPPNYHLLVEAGSSVALSSDEPINHSRPAIDVLFETAADAYGKALTGIILTGANHDGAAGLKAVGEAGGVAIVEDPATAEVATMPAAALAACPSARAMALDEIITFLQESAAS